MCQCEDSVVQQLEQDFKKTLKQGNSLEQWAVWLETVVNQVLKPHEGSPNFPKAARQFLLKWSFYRWVRLVTRGPVVPGLLPCAFVSLLVTAG